MSQFCGSHRVPRGGVDRVGDAADALAVVRMAMSSPARAETIVMLLDPDHRGRTIVVVDGTVDDDAVIEVVEHLAEAVAGVGAAGALVVATVRVGRGPDPGDADRWLDASATAEAFGVELVEWFVIEAHPPGVEPTAWCPRDLLAEPPRWSPP